MERPGSHSYRGCGWVWGGGGGGSHTCCMGGGTLALCPGDEKVWGLPQGASFAAALSPPQRKTKPNKKPLTLSPSPPNCRAPYRPSE